MIFYINTMMMIFFFISFQERENFKKIFFSSLKNEKRSWRKEKCFHAQLKIFCDFLFSHHRRLHCFARLSWLVWMSSSCIEVEHSLFVVFKSRKLRWCWKNHNTFSDLFISFYGNMSIWTYIILVQKNVKYIILVQNI